MPEVAVLVALAVIILSVSVVFWVGHRAPLGRPLNADEAKWRNELRTPDDERAEQDPH